MQITKEENTIALQEQISQFIKKDFTTLLDDIFSSIFQTDEVLKIDQLFLDLGQISENNLEATIKQKLKAQLPIILAQLSISPTIGTSRKSSEKSKIQLLEFFLKNGYSPWWFPNNKTLNIDILIIELFNKNPIQAKNIFESLLRSAPIRKRLKYQLSEATIDSINTAMIGNQIEEYDSYLDQVHYLFQHSKIKTRGFTKKNFQKYIKHLLFVYSGQSPQKEISLNNFGVFLLDNLTSKFNISLREIQHFYQKRISKATTNKVEKTLMKSIELQIKKDKPTQNKQLSKTIKKTDNAQLIRTNFFEKEQIKKDLNEGTFWKKIEKYQNQFQKSDWEKLSLILSSLMDKNPLTFKEHFIGHLKKSKFQESIFRNLSFNFLQKTCQLLNRTNTNIENNYLNNLVHLIQKFIPIPGFTDKKIKILIQVSVLKYWTKNHFTIFDAAVFLENVITYFCISSKIKRSNFYSALEAKRSIWKDLKGQGVGLMKMLLNKQIENNVIFSQTKEQDKKQNNFKNQNPALDSSSSLEISNISAEKSFCYFIENGFLLADGKFKKIIEIENWLEQNATHFNEKFKENLVRLFSVEKNSLRATQQFASKGIHAINLILAGKQFFILQKTMEELKAFFRQKNYSDSVKLKFNDSLQIEVFQFFTNNPKSSFLPNTFFKEMLFNIFEKNGNQPSRSTRNNYSLKEKKIFGEAILYFFKNKKEAILSEKEIKKIITDYSPTQPNLNISAEKSFYYFIENGFLLADGKFKKIIEIENWLEQNITHFNEKFKENLVRLFSVEKNFQRAAQQFASKGIHAINLILAGKQFLILQRTMEELKAFFGQKNYSDSVKIKFNDSLQIEIFQFFINNPKSSFLPNTFLKEMLFNIFEKNGNQPSRSTRNNYSLKEKKIFGEAILYFFKNKKEAILSEKEIKKIITDYSPTQPNLNISAEKSFYHFIENGVLLANGKFKKIIEIENWLKQNATHFNEEFKENLIGLFSDKNIFQRVIQQFTSKGIQAINLMLAGNQFSILQKTLEEFKGFLLRQDYPDSIKKNLDESIHSGLLQFLIENPTPPFLSNAIFKVLLLHISEKNKNEISKPTIEKYTGNKELLIAKEILQFLKDKNQLSKSIFSSITDIEENLQHALLHFPNKLFTTWQTEKKSPLLSTTIVNTFTSSCVDLLIEKIDDFEGGKLKKSWQEGIIFWQILNQIEDFRFVKIQVYQQLVLNHILNKNEYRESVFVKKILFTAAEEQNIPLPYFISIIKKLVEKNGKELKILSKHIASFHEGGNSQKELNQENYFSTNQNKTSNLEQKLLFEGVFDYLKTGLFSQKNPLQSPKMAVDALSLFLKIEPHKTWTSFQGLSSPEIVLDRLEENFPIEILNDLIQVFGKKVNSNFTELIKLWEEIPWTNLMSSKNIHLLSPVHIRIIALQVLLLSKANKIDVAKLFKKLLEVFAKKSGQNLIPFFAEIKTPLLKKSTHPYLPKIILGLENLILDQNNEAVKLILASELNTKLTTKDMGSQGGSKITLLEHFMKNGKMAWWANEVNEKSFNTIITTLSQSNPQELQKLMHKTWVTSIGKNRLLEIIEVKTWKSICNTLHGNYLLLIESVEELFDELVSKSPSSNINKTKLNTVKWDIIMEYVWSAKKFSSETFVVSSLDKMMIATKMDIEKCQPIILNIVDERAKKNQLSFLRINNILQKWIYTPAKLDLEESKFDLLNKEINDARPPKLLAKEKMRESLGKKHQILLDTLLNIRLFLENGSIKEDGVFDTKTDFINTFQILLKEQPARLKQVILHLTKTQNSVIRILSIFPQKIIAKIIELLYGANTSVIVKYWKDLTLIFPSIKEQINKSSLDGFFTYQVLIYYPLMSSGLFSLEKVIGHLIAAFSKKEKINSTIILLKIKESQQKGNIGLREDWEKIIPKLFQLLEGRSDTPKNNIDWNTESVNEDFKDLGLYINNAGLSLIVPFFPRYFDMLGMLENRKFKDETAAIRAVHLIQYIVTGHQETAEHFLAFNKILCGLPLDTPVPKGIKMTTTEKKITEDMMNAIVIHLKAMGTKNLDALRGGFLVREGKLEWHEDGYWNLDVEKKSYDIMMQNMPWSISIINHPWMKNRIQVTWN